MTRRPTLRGACPDDAGRLLAWRNDPVTRRNSFSSGLVAPEQHERWLAAKLAAADCRLWVAELDGVPVGQVRAEATGGDVELHIALAPEARGRGLAAPILAAAAARAVAELGGRRMIGRVIRSNEPSRRAFERAGFAVEDPAGDPLVLVRAAT